MFESVIVLFVVALAILAVSGWCLYFKYKHVSKNLIEAKNLEIDTLKRKLSIAQTKKPISSETASVVFAFNKSSKKKVKQIACARLQSALYRSNKVVINKLSEDNDNIKYEVVINLI